MRKLICSTLSVAAIAGFVVLVGIDSSSSRFPQASGQEKKASVYQPVIPIDILMDYVSDTFDDALDQIKAKKHSKVRKAAYVLAEYMNILQYHTSEEVKKKDMPDWKKVSLEIRADMIKAAEAAKKKDVAAVSKIFKKVEDTCEACHDLRE